jgi:tRNA (guanine-N(7)-)-methyltransferase subunit TRM82
VTPATEQPEQKDWIPSATTLTVHSGRNRKTLEEQLKQKAKGPAKSKEPMRFKHELLLGHVAMLTDVIYASWEGRSYIITADRDEHIRISRSQPQAHIIEGFCFGHEAFINKLCLTRSGRLVSGGGDDHLFVWDWQNYRLLEKLAIRDLVLTHLVSHSEPNESTTDQANLKVAVSGIWNVPSSDMVLVACEGIPALFCLSVGDDAKVAVTIPLNGNTLGVAFVGSSTVSSTIVVSIDNMHKPGSTTEMRDDKVSNVSSIEASAVLNTTKVPRLQYFSVAQDGQWREDSATREAFEEFEGVNTIGANCNLPDEKAVRDMLYHVENLRKRPGAED